METFRCLYNVCILIARAGKSNLKSMQTFWCLPNLYEVVTVM